MKYRIYGRYDLDVVRESDRWMVYRINNGRRRREHDFAVPAELEPNDIEQYLDDMLHELAQPGAAIERSD